jgi:hypothetical protein
MMMTERETRAYSASIRSPAFFMTEANLFVLASANLENCFGVP